MAKNTNLSDEAEIWQRAGRAINQCERLRLRYQRFDGVIRDYLLEPWHLELSV